jgi:hypothetical protein
MADRAAVWDCPTLLPSLSTKVMPSRSSLLKGKSALIERKRIERNRDAYLDRIIGMLTQLAAATAQKGTNRPSSGGALLTRLFRPIAVTKAPEVAKAYDVLSCLQVDRDQM